MDTVDVVARSTGFDSRIASASYSNLAAVLAGIGLAALVLVVQSERKSDTSRSRPNIGFTLHERSSLYLLVALFGFIVSSLNYAVLSGWTEQSKTLYLVPLLIGSGFSVACLMLFCAMVILCRMYLTPIASRASLAVVSIAGFGAYTFLCVNVIDYVVYDTATEPKLWRSVAMWLGAGLFYSILPFLKALGFFDLSNNKVAFVGMLSGSTVLIAIMTILALVLPMWPLIPVFSEIVLVAFVFLVTLFFGFVLSMTPDSE